MSEPCMPLSLERLSLAQGGRLVLEELSGEFPRGSVTALIGANGAGKSTLLAGVMGVLAPLAGSVRCGVAKERRAWLPQQLMLDLSFPISVEELVMTGCWPSHGALRGYGRAHYRRGREIMERLGISALAHRPLGELSGGQRQRALIGRTLMQGAELLVLDEPFANVDHQSVEVLTEVFREMADEGATLLVVLHDMQQLAQLADRVLVLAERRGEWFAPEEIVPAHDIHQRCLQTAQRLLSGASS